MGLPCGKLLSFPWHLIFLPDRGGAEATGGGLAHTPPSIRFCLLVWPVLTTEPSSPPRQHVDAEQACRDELGVPRLRPWV